MLNETLEHLRVAAGGRYCDATLGGGGHARAILEHSAPDGALLGLDRDPEAIERCAATLSEYGARVTLRQGSFAELAEFVREVGLDPLDGVVADLGVSSFQLESEDRGFSFAHDGPLDMRMDPTSGRSAADLIATLDEKRLARVIWEYGEERHARRVARAIKRARRERRLKTTRDLRDVVARAVGRPRSQMKSKIDPATRTFQALRIAVNDELGALEQFLDTVFSVVRPGGTVVVIAFHSLEDRLVKRSFIRLSRGASAERELRDADGTATPRVALLTRKPLRPTETEIANNPRARSARLRAAERLS
jgi:16S rRNA (cytosine1402-N4)-methyltransferase